jgi:predicted  nucleic acid-binding Zn-ribbon protein
MKAYIKKRLKKTIVILLLLFIAMFVFRLIYGYQTHSEPILSNSYNQAADISSGIRKNYASKKYEMNSGVTPVRVDQKYEKIANINTLSTEFEAEEKQIRTQVKDYEGLIQFENKSGNNGQRKLNLIIGIPPENFDSIYHRLVHIGKVQSKQITKTDKTNEYKELNARKASLEQIRESLIELKSNGGRIDEYIQLENRILDIEQQLQGLGVSLGNFDDENEFCTVNLSLSETKVTEIGIIQRIKVALEWTIKNYLLLMVALTFMSLFAYLVLLSLEKIKTKI